MSNPHFVSGAWLEQHLNAPDVVVVDASWYLPNHNRNARAEYAEGHIPGAVFFDIDAIADHSTNLPHMLPTPDAFAAEMGKLGIGDGARIVIYDGLGLFAALADETPLPPETDSEGPEAAFSPVFIRNAVYGTRCSTVVLIDEAGQGQIIERRFGPDGTATGETALGFAWP